MIWAGSGLSAKSDGLKAAEEAASAAMAEAEEAASAAMAEARLERAGLVFLFSTADHAAKYPDMLASVRRITGCGNLVGCSGAGVLTAEGEIEGEKGVAVLALASDQATAAPFVVQNLRGRDRDAGREIGDLVAPYRRGDSLLVVFPDTLNCNPDALFTGIADVLGEIPVVGGGAADDGAGKATYQMCGGKVVQNGVTGVLLSGSLSSSIGVTQACRPIGKPFIVTECDGNVVTKLGDRPAVQALAEALGPSLWEEVSRLAGFIFVGFPVDDRVAGASFDRGGYIVRNIIGVDGESGAITIGKEVAKGDTISFVLRDPMSARDDLKAMLDEEAAVGSLATPRLGLYFNCCARGSGLYGMEGIDTAFIRRAFDALPVAGFFGFCEIASMRGIARLHNYSGVMTLVSEMTPAEGMESLQ
ncbi:MAG: FIST C-terminal domain-containing protein [Acidobacteria bacterium]|nr:FIST C-terminal domain-containing protein [Acidobacteriota bacterium]